MNHGTDNQKVLGNCPSCQRLMQIPVVTDVASVAKCPHCTNEIRVRDLLASVVPEAEIIVEDKGNSKSGEPDYIADRQRVYDDSRPKTREKFEVPNQLYAGASRRNRKRRVGSKGSSARSSSSRDNSSRDISARQRSGNNEVSENDKRVSSSPQDSVDGSTPRIDQGTRAKAKPNPTSVASVNGAATPRRSSVAPDAAQHRKAPKPTPTLTPRPRSSSSRRRSSSEMDDEIEFGAADILKFLFGGLVAAPLAYLALLWVLGVDPFGVASAFERVSPAIIPNSMRSDSFGEEPSSGFAPPAGDSSSSLFEASSDEVEFQSDFEDEGLPLPSLDPDLVR